MHVIFRFTKAIALNRTDKIVVTQKATIFYCRIQLAKFYVMFSNMSIQILSVFIT